MEGLFGFVLAGFALTGSPGPATLSIAATGPAFGARLAAHEYPRELEFVETLPLTATGWIMRKDLREMSEPWGWPCREG